MYQMPVKAIKNILLKEHESFVNSLRQQLGGFVLMDYNRYLLAEMDLKVKTIIQSIQTYDDLENFIGDSRRMSLQEWIDSL